MKENNKKNTVKKTKKNKLIFIIILIILIIVGIIIFINKNKDKHSEMNEEKQTTQYELPDTSYRDMEVKDITMEYLEENAQTMVTMLIVNNTQNSIEDQSLNAYLINENGDIIGQTETYIASIEPNGEYSISVILKGDLTSTTQIKLEDIK